MTASWTASSAWATRPVPADSATGYVKGRNYWHRDNNLYDAYTYAWDGDGNAALAKGNTLKADDPRLVNLFLGPYDSFNEQRAGGVSDRRLRQLLHHRIRPDQWRRLPGRLQRPVHERKRRQPLQRKRQRAATRPDYSANTFYIWGHFVKDVVPTASTSGTTGVLCKPLISFMPCVAVLVE